MGLSKEPSCEAGSFSHNFNPHRVLQPEVLRLSFSWAGNLGYRVCLTPQLFLLAYLHVNVGLPCMPEATLPAQTTTLLCAILPRCLSPPLLPVWMNASSLIPWLSDFHTIQFSGSSGWVVVLLLVMRGSKGYTYAPILARSPEIWGKI